MSIQQNVYLKEDVKAASGDWLKSWMESEAGGRVQYHTLSSQRWRGIQNRCRPGGHVQRIRPTYIGCANGFKDFQSFANWCQEEPGHFDIDSSGSHFHLDKDLLIPGNKIYSSDTCCFVPRKANLLMVFPSSRKQSDLPIGCSFHKRVRQFTAYLSGPDGATIYLGYFRDPMLAHRAWQAAKACTIRQAAEELPGHLLKGKQALEGIATRLEFDLLHEKESKF
ncbi:hypothetical protein ACOI8A_05565 [Pseudomonas sp. P4795]|uniref:hypothetical protein n=1 Tax=Pseudomonas sp. P4795 TaxID=3409915 RepID=UPI003B5CDF31